MPILEQEQRFFEAGIGELEAYLLSDELFHPLEGHQRLTLGGLLLAQSRLRPQVDNPAGHDWLYRLEMEMDRTRSRWRTAWEAKAGREFRARLDLWRNYLLELRQSPEDLAPSYPQEVRWRVMIELLAHELRLSGPDLEQVESLDCILRTGFRSGAFAWDEALAPSFPLETFWFLYGNLSLIKEVV